MPGGDLMKITLLPKTKLGIWSILLSITNLILFVIGSVLPSQTGFTGLEIIIHNPVQTMITILILVLGFISPILALIAVIKKQERSIIVFLVIPTLLTNLLSAVGMILNVFFGVGF
jgi:hypothetical protein